MEPTLTVVELEARWRRTLLATQNAAAAHPNTYRRLKSQAAEILAETIDINEYFPTVEKLVNRLKKLDPSGCGSIFDIFGRRIAPSSIWQVRMLRMECKDLLAHLTEFDRWRRGKHHLRTVK